MSNILGKIIIDAVSIGAGLLAGVATGGMAAGPAAIAVKMGVGFGINETYQIIMNQKFDLKQTATSLAMAASSTMVGHVMYNIEAKLLELASKDVQSAITKAGTIKSQLGQTTQAANRPLTSLIRVMRKMQSTRDTQATNNGLATTLEQGEEMGKKELLNSDDFKQLDQKTRAKIKEELDGDEKHDDIDNGMKPISIKFLLKPNDNLKRTITKKHNGKTLIKVQGKDTNGKTRVKQKTVNTTAFKW